MAHPDPQQQQRRRRRPTALAVAALATTAHAQAAPPTDKYTLTFLNKFAVEFSVLRPTWTGDNYCSGTWRGVTCHTTTGAVSLWLRNAGLEGWMPYVDPDDAARVNVEFLNVSDNQGLHGQFRDSWGNLKQLAFLYLGGTQLAGALPEQWNGMTSLAVLSIPDAQVSGPLPRWTPGAELTEINLGNDRIGGSLPREWALMTGLGNVVLGGGAANYADAPPQSSRTKQDAWPPSPETRRQCWRVTAPSPTRATVTATSPPATPSSPAATTAAPFAISAAAAAVAIAAATGAW